MVREQGCDKKKRFFLEGDLPLKEELLNALDVFAAVQHEHREKLTAGKLQGLFSWRQKRERVFLRMKKCLEVCEKDIDTAEDHAFLRAVQRKIRALLDGESILNEEAGKQSERIKSKLNALRKGKSVLEGYSLSRGVSPRPRFLSNKT